MRVCLIHRRGIETNLELSPGEATTEGGRNPLGGVLNEQAMCKVEELETENAGLRSMLVDLQVMRVGVFSRLKGDRRVIGSGHVYCCGCM